MKRTKPQSLSENNEHAPFSYRFFFFPPLPGVLTGSVYKDYALLKNGFPAENVVNGSVIAVKTHEFGPDALEAFDRAILLVRDPFASLLVSHGFKYHSGLQSCGSK